ncbi:MAG TPA: amidophosphoribosyltransferase [Candidatus Hydrogenedentes bacterium]|nr:amidophosphoribosyltransferase [Candidatus Hydrogenedentota bacterium]
MQSRRCAFDTQCSVTRPRHYGDSVADGDHLREECGIFGIHGHPEASKLIYLGLYALQHRGQEGAGIVCGQEGVLTAHRGVGLVADVFKPHKLERVAGDCGIGHVRYSTFGTSNLRNVQPLVVDYARGGMAVAHNGNLTNAAALRETLEAQGAIFQSTTDSEVIIHLISRSQEKDFTDCVIDALCQVVGAYSVVIHNGDSLVASRDPHGFRPLWLGRLEDAYVVASETCAFDIIDAEWIREIEPGEVVTITRHRAHSSHPFPPEIPKQCLFEFVYVARPDSYIFGQSVDVVRKNLGRELARQAPVDADVVMAVPDSSNPAALGYSHESGLPFDMGFIRNHYVGRTFIEPDQGIRDFGVKIKLNPSRSAVEGKRIVLVDDSIVRGTTARKIIKTLRRAGAREVHFRVASPKIINSCYYGIDTPNREKLIAHRLTVEEIREFLNVDSLEYLELEALLRATGGAPTHFCTACFTGEYPTPTPHDYELHTNNLRHVDHSTAVYER